jgi:hypothetical protein
MSKKLTKRALYAIYDPLNDVDTYSLARLRTQAISRHLWSWQDERRFGPMPEYHWGRGLTSAQRKFWEHLKRRGHRVVRVDICLAA